MDKQSIISFFLSAIPALWAAMGPVITVSITALFNTVVKSYVPREVQIPLAGLVSAVLAGLVGGDPAAAAVEGSAIQTALSLPANKFLAGAKTATK